MNRERMLMELYFKLWTDDEFEEYLRTGWCGATREMLIGKDPEAKMLPDVVIKMMYADLKEFEEEG